MKTLITKYEKLMKSCGKNLRVILAEKKRGEFDEGRYLFLSETDKEWIIHPAFLMNDGQVGTGNGTYLFKSGCSYEDIKEVFASRL